jgi:DNA repair exonuclease SbcCD ATPase subunit
MRTIDGTRYISAREYAEMANLTPGRVSQLKAELPFVKFEEFGIELINFDLLDLQQNEKVLAQSKYETTNPIHQYSYKDLGNFFGKFAMDLVQFKGNADFKINEIQERANQLMQDKENLENEKRDSVNREKGLNEQLSNLKQEYDVMQGKMNALGTQFEEVNESKNSLSETYEILVKENDELRIVHNDLKHDVEIKIIENKNLHSENEGLKSRVQSLESSLQTETKFREEFKDFKELVMKKLKN